jgi:hypothetical protein
VPKHHGFGLHFSICAFGLGLRDAAIEFDWPNMACAVSGGAIIGLLFRRLQTWEQEVPEYAALALWSYHRPTKKPGPATNEARRAV